MENRTTDPNNSIEAQRVPTAAEAIPYSPFSSIVPFDSGVIPSFHALPQSAAAAFDHSLEVMEAKNEIARLSAGAKSALEASKRCQKTLRDVQKLLDAQSLTQYKFRAPQQHRRNDNAEETSETGGPHGLSSYAQMVHANTDVPFVCLDTTDETPSQARPILVQRHTPMAAQKEVQVSASEAVAATTRRKAVVQVPSVKPAERKAYEPDAPTNATQASQKLMVRARIPTAAERQAYEYIPLSSHPSYLEASHANVQPASLSNPTRAVTADQRHRANEAVNALQSQLISIFEAEDHMQPDTSGENSCSFNSIFEICDYQGHSVPTLHARILADLDAAVSEVVKYGRLESINAEDLVRIQRLCEASISFGQSLPVQISDHWSEKDLREWLRHLVIIENSLVAARTMMRIMAGGSQMRELQSEDNVRIILDAIRAVIDACIIPAIEERKMLGEKIKGDKNGPENPKFRIASENRATLLDVVRSLHKCLRQLGDLCVKTSIDETSISSVEYLCRTLIFGENAASNKDSVFDNIEVFESLRKAGMNLIAKVFTKYVEQRSFIIDQILQSLEKLPSNKQSARQLKLADAKPIQLVSALLLRLVQASGTAGDHAKNVTNPPTEDNSSDEDSVSAEAAMGEGSSDSDVEIIKVVSHGQNRRPSKAHQFRPPSDLTTVAKPLYDAARTNASEIVRTLLQRALQTSKSSDEPFRKLLDIFVEDFLNVLGSSDWPAAELILRRLVSSMLTLVENNKSSVPSRSLALEFLGIIGSGILDIRASAQDSTKSLDCSDAASSKLANFARSAASNSMDIMSFLDFDGPYRILIEYLEGRRGSHDEAQVLTARGYHLMQWAEWLNSKEMAAADTDKTAELKNRVLCMIKDPQWLGQNTRGSTPSIALGKLAAKLVVSQSILCRAFDRVLFVMLKSMSSEQPTIRSRSLKSVSSLLEKSPSMLDKDENILDPIMRLLRDRSSLVRDSALILIEKCVSLKPTISNRIYVQIVERANDASAPIRKRAVKFLKTLYHMKKDNSVRSVIANAVISRVTDVDESVAETARATVDEIWFSGFTGSIAGIDGPIELRAQVALIIQTIQYSDAVASVLEALIKKFLMNSKQESKHLEACKAFIVALFDGVIDTNEIPGSPSQSSILHALTIFARAAPQLFSADQLERIGPYAANLDSQDDIVVFQHVITILRYTFPHVKDIDLNVLENLQRALMKSISRIHSSELAVVAPCLWAITSVLKNVERLVTMVTSAMNRIVSWAHEDSEIKPQEAAKICRLLAIVGNFARACDLDKHKTIFQQKGFQHEVPSAFMVELACRFTSKKNSKDLRIAALEAVCAICQNYPEHFLRDDVNEAFILSFAEKMPELEHVLLINFAEFFADQESLGDDESGLVPGRGIETGTQRLGNTYQATHVDSASGSLSQRYLAEFFRIALASIDEVALAAARIVVIINRQGRANPKESGPYLVALETCPNETIARLAFMEHKAQYAKSESAFDQMLMHSVLLIFDYQLHVVQNASGALGQPPVSKLHFLWTVLKTGKAKTRSKFFASTCAKISFDLEKLGDADSTLALLLFARFAVEALAFLEYDRIDELLFLLSALEKAFSNSGNPVAQAIESEIHQISVLAATHSVTAAVSGAEMDVEPDDKGISLHRLRQLAVSSQILCLLSETHSFIRRAWNMQRHLGKAKKSAKDNATKVNRATNYAALAEGFQNRIEEIMKPAETQDEQRAKCNSFAEIFKRDDDVKVGSEEDNDMDVDEADDARSEASSNRSMSAPSGTPRKRKRASLPEGVVNKRGKQAKASNHNHNHNDDERDWK